MLADSVSFSPCYYVKNVSKMKVKHYLRLFAYLIIHLRCQLRVIDGLGRREGPRVAVSTNQGLGIPLSAGCVYHKHLGFRGRISIETPTS